jgi:diguanylate cyclase (GGDEF)-like protein
MTKPVKQVIFQQEDKDIQSKLITDFCSVSGKKQRNTAILKIRNQFLQYSGDFNVNKQLSGTWIAHFLHQIIPHAANLRHIPEKEQTDLVHFLMNLPLDEKSEDYKALFSTINATDVLPITPKKYLMELQICYLLLELGSGKVNTNLKELRQLTATGFLPSRYSLFVKMLEARAFSLSGDIQGEQIEWLDLILQSWHHLDKRYTVFFLSQWITSLKWIKTHPDRKELLISLLEAAQHSGNQNLAVILYELFNLSDKAISTGEKLNYLSRLHSLPKELFRVDQLQNMYYFSGNIKSSVDTGFMDSVSDFQQSNYYIYRYWSWINSINHFFQETFNPGEYMEIQARIEQKTMELINLVNTQSNIYVETIQSNFVKIEELYHQVEELSLRDSLTGLYNRRFLYNNINELLQLAVRQQSPLSFVLIDIDDFKPVNDTYGHLAGDYILKDMSNHLKGFFRKSDFVIRYGGEEFLIVMFNSDQLQAEQTLENLRSSINSRVLRYMNTYLHITVSVGIASCKFDSSFNAVNLEKLIAEADAAMYESKTLGKNRITSRIISSCSGPASF